MPVEQFNALFTCWGENEKLSLKRLRQKAITLLALVTMLRPSDVAPKSVHFDPFSFEHSKMQFNTDQIVFESSGSMRISFHGIKNDTSRSGFQVVVPPATNILLDPVKTLRDYIERSMSHRKMSARGNAVFLSLYSPYKALSAQTIASVLEDSIADAGLDKKLYTAKSFRPTGATVQIEKGVDPKTVMKMGRWKTDTVFFEHYVHSRTPSTFTDNIVKT